MCISIKSRFPAIRPDFYGFSNSTEKYERNDRRRNRNDRPKTRKPAKRPVVRGNGIRTTALRVDFLFRFGFIIQFLFFPLPILSLQDVNTVRLGWDFIKLLARAAAENTTRIQRARVRPAHVFPGKTIFRVVLSDGLRKRRNKRTENVTAIRRSCGLGFGAANPPRVYRRHVRRT